MRLVSTSETVEVTGHLMDSGILSRVLDDIREYGGDWVITKIDVGRERERHVDRDDPGVGRAATTTSSGS